MVCGKDIQVAVGFFLRPLVEVGKYTVQSGHLSNPLAMYSTVLVLVFFSDMMVGEDRTFELVDLIIRWLPSSMHMLFHFLLLLCVRFSLA